MKKPGPQTEQRVAGREGRNRAAGAAPSPSHAADLERLFEAHRGKLFQLCLRLTGDHGRAEELVQQTLETAWRKLPEFHGGARFGPWIFGIARHQLRNDRRKRRDLLSEDGLVDPASPAAGALRSLQRHEREALLASAAAAALTAQEQEIVHLRYVEEVPLAQLDAMYTLDGSGARGVLQRCKRKLKRELSARLEAMGRGPSLLRSDADEP